VINRPSVIAPIIGARTLKYLEDSLAGADLELGESFTARLDEVSAPTPDEYPYGPFGEKQHGRYVGSSKQVTQ
jgi:aryl-alcohol dehydrogenase-like predicted oxidoreductase